LPLVVAVAAVTNAPIDTGVEAAPVARFADPDRKAKLAAAFPEIDRLFREWAEKQPVPGVAWGVGSSRTRVP
jgi:hypothetical protein